MNRRHFLIASGAALTGAGLVSLWGKPKWIFSARGPHTGFLMGEGDRELPADPAMGLRSRRASKPGAVTIMDALGGIHERWPTPFLPHLAKQNPWNRDQIVGIQKWGPHLAVFSVKDRGLTKLIPSEDHVDYFGHAEFLDQGRILAVSAHNWKNDQGEIHLFETHGFEKTGILSSFGSNPHDLQIDAKNPDVLLIANSGAYVPEGSGLQAFRASLQIPKMCWIDWKEKKLLKSIETADPEAFLPAHFLQTSHKLLMYGSSTRKKEGPSLGVLETDASFRVLTSVFGQDALGECLNAYVDPTNHRIWLSVPSSHQVVIIDARTYDRILEIPIPQARSLTKIAEDVLFISTHSERENRQLAFEISSMKPLSLDELQKKLGGNYRLADAYGIHTTPYRAL